MRILQIINGLGTGGAEKLLVDSVLELQERGISVTILLLNGTETPFYHKLKEEFKGELISLGKGSVYNPFLVFKMIKKIKGYDCIQVHLFPTLYWVAIAHWLGNCKVPLVYTEHSTTNNRRTKWYFKKLDQLMYSRYQCVVAITPLVKQNLQNHLGRKTPVIDVIPNGVDIQRIHAAVPYSKAELELPDDALVLLQVARFYEPKDPMTLLESMRLLDNKTYLLLVGDGAMRGELENFVQENGLSDRVRFLGVRTDIERLLKSADIVLLSSKYEGLSLAAIEGMASGKPFIASDVPGISDSVGGAGLLFTQGDSSDLASKIKEVSEDAVLKSRLIRQCLERSKQYDSATMVKNYIALYQKLQ